MKALASLKLTAAALGLLAAGILWAYFERAQSAPALVAPMALLALNLGCAILVNPKFRAQLPLLVFHVALLVLVLLAAAGRLTYLNGRLELSTGEAFTGELLDAEQGPLHRPRLAQAAFVNEGFEIDYAPKWKRLETRNVVRWRSARGEETGVIGDQTPLILQGYRFYTTSNKGFAPVFVWQRAGAPAQRGSVHLPPYPVLQFAQQVQWTPPGAEHSVTVRLPLDEELIDYERASRFSLPPSRASKSFTGEARTRLRAGRVARDSPRAGCATRDSPPGWATWCSSTGRCRGSPPPAALAAAALGWHFWRRFAARPWNEAR